MSPLKSTAPTSWGQVADWYEDHLAGGDTYHEKVIAPHVLRLMEPIKGKPIIEIGCGEGYFTRLLKKNGHTIVGSDISEELIHKAQQHNDGIRYVVAPADTLSFAQDVSAAGMLAVLTLQNMERIEPVMQEAARVLSKDGRILIILNHPAFRIPQRSSWGFDQEKGMQYRRLDGYLSAHAAKIDMHPGARAGKTYTHSYHRSLQDYSKALRTAGFVITKIEEWISHRVSEQGPRKQAEDVARKEFPLFLAIEAMQHPTR